MGVALLVTTAQLGCESEKAKWNLAQALNLRQSGRVEEAASLCQIAMDQDPDNCQIKLNLAKMLAESGKGEIAVALCDEHHQCFPNDLPSRKIRSDCLQYLGRFDEALSEYKKSLSSRVSRTPIERNNLAYFRALAKKELSKAAADVQQAIDEEESRYWGAYILPLQVRTIVSAGLISRHVDQRRHSLRLLDRMIQKYELKLERVESLIKKLVAEQIAMVFPVTEQHEKQTLNARANGEILRTSLALMLTTRALMLEDVNRFRCVDADRLRIEELGFEFSKLASDLPSDLACLKALSMATIYLDTRGFVSVQQPWREVDSEEAPLGTFRPVTGTSNYESALEDLDLAVLAAQLGQAAINSPLYNSIEISVEQVRRRKNMARRATAVLLYHRMKAHERGGNSKAADSDQCRIQALGFPPDEALF